MSRSGMRQVWTRILGPNPPSFGTNALVTLPWRRKEAHPGRPAASHDRTSASLSPDKAVTCTGAAHTDRPYWALLGPRRRAEMGAPTSGRDHPDRVRRQGDAQLGMPALEEPARPNGAARLSTAIAPCRRELRPGRDPAGGRRSRQAPVLPPPRGARAPPDRRLATRHASESCPSRRIYRIAEHG